jgi:carotenoid 1,2-hydratase
MTERGRASVRREARQFVIGPSRIEWLHDTLTIHVDEVGVPFPKRVRGTVRVRPRGLANFVAALDNGGRHRWAPIAPCARVEVEMAQPGLRWQGDGYLDSNEGDEPIDRPFVEWDWSRGSLADGGTGVVYDVQPKQGSERVIACRFKPSGEAEAFEPPPRQLLPRTGWRIERRMRSDAGILPRVTQSLEDTPFYARSVLESGLLGERVTSVHETLNLPRLTSPVVQAMLPWRMPRRG